MAKKKPDLESIFTRTEPEQTPAEPVDDKVKARGVGLKISEWARFDAIAEEMGVKTHALAKWALEDFLRRYAAGELPITTTKRPTLPGL